VVVLVLSVAGSSRRAVVAEENMEGHGPLELIRVIKLMEAVNPMKREANSRRGTCARRFRRQAWTA